MEIKNKTVLITGSSSGIGRACALEFAKQGANVIINCSKSIRKAKQTLEEIEKLSANCLFVQADVSVQKQVDQLFKKAIQRFGTINILVNNVSKQGPSDFFKAKNEIWKQFFQESLMSAVMCSKKFVSLNKEKKNKKIINVSSIFGLFDYGSKNFIPYSCAKAALNSLTKNLAKLVAPNILVNAVAPGYTRTPYWDNVSQKVIRACANEKLIKRLIKPEEIADAVVFLSKNDAITGQILLVDGGLSLSR